MKRTYQMLNINKSIALPKAFKDDDVRFTEELAELFIKTYTKQNDVIFDPFAGYGTTLSSAEKLGRQGFGIEIVKQRVDYIRTQISNKENIICGDSLKLNSYQIPQIDFLFTSPPYMTKNNHDEYPFAGYKVTGAGYSQYLADLGNIYKQIKEHMKQDAYAVIEVANIRKDGITTTLAWDVANEVSKILTFEKEIVVCWENDLEYNGSIYGYEYDHSYCLVFKNIIV